MDPFLAHCIILAWLGYGAARRVVADLAGQILTTALLAWGNIVVTCLLLAAMRRLDEPAWFFSLSSALALLGFVLLRATGAAIAPEPSDPNPAEPKLNPWLLAATILLIAPLAGLSLVAACLYEPAGPAALSHLLPRALYYLGQGSLAHFDAADLRQVALPFNSSLLYLLGLVYRAPLPCLAILNLLAWLASGAAVYRLCRLCHVGRNLALATCGLLLAATPVLAAASSVTVELPETAALIGAASFALQAARTGRLSYALLAGLALGLAGGSDLRALCLLVAAGAGGIAWGAWRGINRLRPWIFPALLSAALALPFAAINVAERGPGLRQLLQSDTPALTPAIGTLFKPLIRQPVPPDVLGENSIGWGLVGVMLLVAMGLGLARLRGPAGWAAWLAAAWVLADLALPAHTGPATGAFIPAAFLLGPALAVMLGAGGTASSMHRRAGYAVVGLAAALAGWSALIYLGANASHPLAPLLAAPRAWPKPAPLPLLLDYPVATSPRINVETDGAHEEIFRIMARAPQAVFTSRQALDPAAYNLFSRLTGSRTTAFVDLARRPAYTLIPIESKRTAGVEFLATIGTGPGARDYFGLVPQADRTAPIVTNRCLLVTLYPAPTDTNHTLIRVAGLNPADHARLAINLEYDDGRVAPLTVFEGDGSVTVSILPPFRQLAFRVLDAASGEQIGSAAISYRPQSVESAKSIAPSRPTNGRSIFVTDLVLPKGTPAISADGLLPVEGPFPQWDLPYLRWQREPVARIRIPADPRLTHLQLSFSVRLHVRKKAALDVRFNGELVQRYRIDQQAVWVDQTVELTPRPGENVLEFHDAPLNNEPDWLGYLDLYPDVKKHVAINRLPAEEGARAHYERHGRPEGRTLPIIEKPEPAPDGYYFMFRSIRVEGFTSR